MGRAVGPVYQLTLNVVMRDKIADFTRYPNRQIRSGIALNRLDARDSSACRVPECLLPNAIGCYNPKSGNDRASLCLMSHTRFPYIGQLTIASHANRGVREAGDYSHRQNRWSV